LKKVLYVLLSIVYESRQPTSAAAPLFIYPRRMASPLRVIFL
jgi:hypothetical protein